MQFITKYKIINVTMAFALGTTSTIYSSNNSEAIIPDQTHSYDKPTEDIALWSLSAEQKIFGENRMTELEKIQTLTKFAERVLYNSKDLDGDLNDMVNEHFWELL